MALPMQSLLFLSLELPRENVKMMQMVREGAVSGSSNAIAPIAFLRTSVRECEDGADGEGMGCQWLCQCNCSYSCP